MNFNAFVAINVVWVKSFVKKPTAHGSPAKLKTVIIKWGREEGYARRGLLLHDGLVFVLHVCFFVLVLPQFTRIDQ